MRGSSFLWIRKGSLLSSLTVFGSAVAPQVDEQEHDEAESDNDRGPEPGNAIVPVHPFEVDGDGNSAGDAQIVACQEQRCAEFTKCTCECERGSGGNAAPGKGEHQFQEDACIAPSQGASCIEHIGIEVFKSTQGTSIHQGECNHYCGNNRCGPAEDKGKSDIDEEAAKGGIPAA